MVEFSNDTKPSVIVKNEIVFNLGAHYFPLKWQILLQQAATSHRHGAVISRVVAAEQEQVSKWTYAQALGVVKPTHTYVPYRYVLSDADGEWKEQKKWAARCNIQDVLFELRKINCLACIMDEGGSQGHHATCWR